ncbi:MAG: uracil-DNA glycosylase, partial [Saprospiraceae bacterium]
LIQLEVDRQKGLEVYPPSELMFNAFNLCPFDKLKVVILGQDPYHQPGLAMGLAFSVPIGQKIPPSLRNIYKELNRDLHIPIPSHGDLSTWAKQGVLLLNTSLSVLKNQPNSHQNIGWKDFTNHIITLLNDQKSNIVFLLWGNHARSKRDLIDPQKHAILESPHPSPLARGGFYGNNHFSTTNIYLESKKIAPIDWKII